MTVGEDLDAIIRGMTFETNPPLHEFILCSVFICRRCGRLRSDAIHQTLVIRPGDQLVSNSSLTPK